MCFPASYKTTLNQKELIQLAIGFSTSRYLHQEYYSCAFADCAGIAARIIRDNLDSKNITKEMQWEYILNIAQDNENDDSLRYELIDLSRKICPDCIFRVALKTLDKSIGTKMGKMLLDLIYENIPGSDPASGLLHEIETLRNQYLSRVELHYSGQLASANNRSMEDDDHGGSDLYRSLSIEKGRLTQAIEEIDLDNCQSIEEAEILLDKIIDGKGIRALKDHLPDIS